MYDVIIVGAGPAGSTLARMISSKYYAWIIPKENFLVPGAALPPGKGVYHSFSRLKQLLNQYGFKLENSIKQESAPVLRPAKTEEIFAAKGNVMLIGEAAGLISPSSAEGLSYVFSSALLASRSLNEGLVEPAARYRTMAGSLYSNINHKLIKNFLIYFAPSRRAIMASGLFTIKPEKN